MSDFERKKQVLTAKQTKAIQALLTEPTTRAAAKIAGVSEPTLWRWLNAPAFAEAYRAARSKLLDNALTVIQSAAADSARYLHSVVNDERVPAPVRVRAACEILSFGLKAREVLEIEDRLCAIEAQLGAQRKNL